MEAVTIEAKVPGKDGAADLSAQLTVQYPKTVSEAVSAYGEEAVLTNAFSNWRVTLQSNIRGALRRGESQEEIQTRLGSSKMGVAAAGVKIDPVQAYLARFQSATPEEQKAMLAELQKRAAKK